jgi:alpha-N-arabinofuranosidase
MCLFYDASYHTSENSMRKPATISVLLVVVATTAIRLPGEEISQYVRSSDEGAHIEVRAAQRASFKVPRTVYGTFLENIGSSVYGGLSAQLLDNPSLEPYYSSLETLERKFLSPQFRVSTGMGLPLPWLPLREKDGWRYEPRYGQAANSYSYLYVMGMADREVGIRQAIYLPVHRERTYGGSLFASSAQGPAELEVSFRKHDFPAAVLATATVKVPGGGRWSKLPFCLALKEDAVAPLQQVDFVVALRGEHRVSLDFIRLYPIDAVRGMDPDVIRAAKILNTPLIRYGGNFTSGYHWRDGVGPLDQRPTRLNQSWGYPEYNDIGTDEIMAFCELIGARAQICLNLGSGTAEEARGWVEYCQGSASTPEAKKRAADGHPVPYPVMAWEFGNELWGDWQIGWLTPEAYARRYHEYYGAIRDAVAPGTLLLATGADIDSFEKWNGALLNADARELQFLTTHFVVDMDEMRKADADRDFKWAADLAVPVGVGRALEPVRKQIDGNPLTRGRVRLAYTEYLFWARDDADVPRYDNLGGAVNGAAWMNMLLRNADFVPVADMTGIIDFAGIQKRRSKVFLTPQAWVFSLYSSHAGDTLVATRTDVAHYDVHEGQRRTPEIADVPYLDVLATRDSKRSDLALFVVNRDWKNAVQTRIELKDFVAAPKATVHTVMADSILAKNDEENPEMIRPTVSQVELTGDGLNYRFPPASVTVLVFRPR